MSSPIEPGPRHHSNTSNRKTERPAQNSGNYQNHTITHKDTGKGLLGRLKSGMKNQKKLTDRDISDQPSPHSNKTIGFDYALNKNGSPYFKLTGPELSALKGQLPPAASSRDNVHDDPRNLAAGTNGYISLAKVKSREVAVKRLYHEGRINGGAFMGGQELIREARILNWLQSQPGSTRDRENIIQMLQTGMVGHEPLVVLALASQGSLSGLMQQKSNFSQIEIMSFAQQLAAGLGGLHSRDIIHQDIKPENLVIDAAHTLKICDFGEATGEFGIASYDALGRHLPLEPGGTMSLRPGARMFEPVGAHSDIWAAGRVIMTLILGDDYSVDFCQALNMLDEFNKNVDQCTPEELANLKLQIHNLVDLYLSISPVAGTEYELPLRQALYASLEPDFRKRCSAKELLHILT